MALTSTQRLTLIGIAVGVVIGLVMGVVGASSDFRPGVRGGVTGALIVVTFQILRKQMAARESSAASDRT
jgi:hypothetical protein